MVTRRNFSSEFKAKVVLKMLREEETLSQIAARHKIHHTVLQNWKRTVTDGLPGLFADPRRKSAEEMERYFCFIPWERERPKAPLMSLPLWEPDTHFLYRRQNPFLLLPQSVSPFSCFPPEYTRAGTLPG